MNEKLKENRPPDGRMTMAHFRKIQVWAQEKYGDAYCNMGLQQILEENPDWVEEIQFPIQLPGQVITSEESLRGIETAAEIHAVIEGSRRNFIKKTSGAKRDSVPPA